MSDTSALMRLACKEPWHTEAAYEDGGHPHYIECYEPVTETLLTREEAAADSEVRAAVLAAYQQGFYEVTGDESDDYSKRTRDWYLKK